jgi:hypothetical protein
LILSDSRWWYASVELRGRISDVLTHPDDSGSREVLIAERNAATAELQSANSRARLFYCSASDDGESTAELSKINMQPKRAPGDAQPQPFPDAPGTATFDSAARELTIPVLPDHGSFIRAYRQPAGGSAELAGVSSTNTVSIVDFTPLTPGVSYTIWVVAVNSRGEGAISNKITFTA